MLDVRVQRRGVLIRIVYALCLVGATVNHVRGVLGRGWLPNYLPTLSAVYWDSLTFLDPLAAALLFLRPRLGIGLTVAIIVSDIVHNVWFTAAHPTRGSFFEEMTSSVFMMSQLAFLLFVAITAPVAWKLSAAAAPRG